MKESFGDRAVSIVFSIILIIFALFMIFPIYYIIIVSFTDSSYYNLTGGKVFFLLHPSLDAYKYLLSTKTIAKGLGVSSYITVLGTFLSLIINASFSYGVSRKRLRGRKILLIGVLITMIFNPGIIPGYLLVKNLHLIDNLWALILPVLTSGWYVILMKGFFEGIPQSLEEAAYIDGCNDISIFFRIILPLSMASIAAFSMFYLVAYWNTYLTAVFYINKSSLWPMQVIVRNLIDIASVTASGEAAAEIQSSMPSEMLKMAAVVIAIIPILTIYPFLQKYFTQGAMMGSIKE